MASRAPATLLATLPLVVGSLVGLLGSSASAATPDAPAPATAGGQLYRARLDAGGATVALWRYTAPAGGSGPPIVLLPELGFDHRAYDPLAVALQRRGREVFVLEWRGTGQSAAPVRGAGGLDALFLGDAPAALDAALVASGAPHAQLLGHGLGGAAAVLLAGSERGARVSALALIAVPARWEVPNEVVRRLLAALDARPAAPAGMIELAPWADFPAPLPGRAVARLGEGGLPAPDLFGLLLAHGTELSPARTSELKAGLGRVAPELLRDLRRWMEQGDLVLPDGPLARGGALSAAWGRLGQSLLLVAPLRDDLVHPEHALAARTVAAQAPREEWVLQRLEGAPEDAGHLAPMAPWAAQALGARLFDFFEAHR